MKPKPRLSFQKGKWRCYYGEFSVCGDTVMEAYNNMWMGVIRDAIKPCQFILIEAVLI